MRRFCSGKQTNRPNPEKLSDQAETSQQLWDTLIPERNIGFTHPMFFLLAGLTIGLHYYNKSQDEKLDEELRARRLSKEREERN